MFKDIFTFLLSTKGLFLHVAFCQSESDTPSTVCLHLFLASVLIFLLVMIIIILRKMGHLEQFLPK